MASAVEITTTPQTGIDHAHRRVIIASSLGTMFEWYDFYLYGSLAALISRQFFAGVSETTAFIFALLAFAAGFAVRPFGAAIFGRLGDMAGRKHTFLITIVIMGVATALVGVLPTYASVGVLAPIILITLRLLQGLAVGGEYGGAATYIAEHAPAGQRAYYTSFGRKPQVVIGCLIAALAMFPIFRGLTHYANPGIEAAQANHPVVVVADPDECSFQFDPVGGARFASSCDVAKSALASMRIPYSNEAASPARSRRCASAIQRSPRSTGRMRLPGSSRRAVRSFVRSSLQR